MRDRIRSFWRVVALLLGIGFCAPAPAADPLTMLLLTIAREALFAAAREHLAARAEEPLAAAPSTYPGTMVEPAHVRRLIDEGFGYLTTAQRDEVFEALHRNLMDPKNAAVRGPMVEYFAERAIAMRFAQQRLANLSQSEKRALAAEFRKEVAGLAPEEAAQLAELLRRGVLPVPGDLNDMLLAELGAR